MRKRIAELEESNEISTLALSRVRVNIRRMRLEYAVLLDSLEKRVQSPQNGELHEFMRNPPNAAALDDAMEERPAFSGARKRALLQEVRDPELPRKPQSALAYYEQLHNVANAAEQWAHLSEAQKLPYLKIAEVDRERYARDVDLYALRRPEEMKTEDKGLESPKRQKVDAAV